jgi:valyl-tRNA synthetase
VESAEAAQVTWWPGENLTVRYHADLSGAVDIEAERRRLTKDLAVERKALEQSVRKLDNEQFLAKAPEAEVDKVRARRVSAEAEIARLEAQLGRLDAR